MWLNFKSKLNLGVNVLLFALWFISFDFFALPLCLAYKLFFQSFSSVSLYPLVMNQMTKDKHILR